MKHIYISPPPFYIASGKRRSSKFRKAHHTRLTSVTAMTYYRIRTRLTFFFILLPVMCETMNSITLTDSETCKDHSGFYGASSTAPEVPEAPISHTSQSSVQTGNICTCKHLARRRRPASSKAVCQGSGLRGLPLPRTPHTSILLPAPRRQVLTALVSYRTSFCTELMMGAAAVGMARANEGPTTGHQAAAQCVAAGPLPRAPGRDDPSVPGHQIQAGITTAGHQRYEHPP